MKDRSQEGVRVRSWPFFYITDSCRILQWCVCLYAYTLVCGYVRIHDIVLCLYAHTVVVVVVVVVVELNKAGSPYHLGMNDPADVKRNTY
jgi:hypothetical protein